MLDFDGLNDLIGTPEMIALSDAKHRPTNSEVGRAPVTSLDRSLAVLNGRLVQIADEMDATLSLRVQSDHCGGARRLPRPLSCRHRRDLGAGTPACRFSSAPWRSQSRR
jgi:hypothetical protein